MNSSTLVALPVVLPIMAAAISVAVGVRRLAQRAVTLVVLAVVVVVSAVLVVRADDVGHVVQRSGGWSAPLGITLVVDRFAAVMLLVSSVVLLAVAIYAIGQSGAERERVAFHPLYLVLAAGVFTSFVTADLFNLFVAFEMMLAASYVLITLGGRPDQVRSGMTYVVISLVASTLFITVLALLYAATGTVNMADLSQRLTEVDPALREGFAVMLLVVFGIKAGLFPLFFWLPDSYPTAPGPVTAIFAGLLTKVGVYAIIRTQTLMFGPGVDGPSWMGPLLLWVAGLTMVVGVIGAIAQDDMKRILAFHIISQIGYMIFGLGLATVAGLAGAVFYIVHHIIVKTALFLVAGLVSRRAGSSRLSEVGGLVRDAPVIAILFAVPALSLAGLPPFSGFLAKFALVDAGIAASSWVPVAASLAVGLFTLFSMTKIWSGVFWGVPEDSPTDAPTTDHRFGAPALMLAPTAALAIASIAVSVAAGPLYDVSERAATDLLERTAYVEAVLDRDAQEATQP